ncbi:DMATS type aromatic prenyltransferase [Talaromyces proteolyticus]|uniref:DMATS type aromatic prenyltransferase n=1 Tax=Talaromyces proteolyticus TaxID=1131652 RepID=A0AAD4PV48_9EURO|nr:DMATS type aromatic prenyltransferase [Talaromyces proteolyticus]KAH8692969.1 DMATS type aromatic prenyltransferase [Talaromyces proteolyticus]
MAAVSVNAIDEPEATAGNTAYREIWLEKTKPLFAKMLASANYPPPDREFYMAFYTQTLIPLMGPYPQKFRSAVTRSGLPIEFSANYTQHSPGDPVWRIGFEPVSRASGSAGDPYNQIATGALLSQLDSLNLRGYDTMLSEHFVATHTVNRAERESLGGQQLDGSDLSPSQVAFGFDLKGGEIAVKGYTFPALKCKVTGRQFGTLFRDSIDPLFERMGGYRTRASFDTIDEYMKETNGWSDFSFFSWDCVAPAKARLKLYSSTNIVTWSKMEEIWTLGGRVVGESSMQGLKQLRRLWELTQIKDGYRAFTGGFDNDTDSTPTPIIWNYEIRPGSPEPLTKVYFPIHGENDLTIVRGVGQFLQEIGLVKQGRSYERTVREYYPARDLSKTACLTSWLSFAYTEATGAYLSVYYHSSSDYPWAEKEAK